MAVKALGRYGEKDKMFARVIKSCVERQGIKPEDMVKRAGTCLSLYYKRLKKPEELTVRELRAYILEGKIPEEDILDFLYDKRELKK